MMENGIARNDAPLPMRNNRALVLKLLLVVAAAFAFGFALVPLYDVLCAAASVASAWLR